MKHALAQGPTQHQHRGPARGRGIRLGGARIVVVIVVLLMGGDPGVILSMLEQGGSPSSPSSSYETAAPRDEEQARFVSGGLRAAAGIGDDRLQRMAGRGVQPDAFTHGSSAQRVAWFRTGLESGDPAACDTFSG